MPAKFDGRYDYTKPWVTSSPSEEDSAQPSWSFQGPWASNMERLTQQALLAATIPGRDLQQFVRPPLPQIRLFPDRFGYGDRVPPTIEDVISVDRAYQEPRVSWYSGSPAGYSGSSRNSLESN